jgi:hypothetical protein
MFWQIPGSQDVRKLTQPGSVVLAQLAPSLMDDECEASDNGDF